ncbi:TPA: sigma factor-like helix-turn-helix DNA-binding protein [Escherichia coli]
MTKKELSEYYWTKKNIEKLEEKLLEIDAQLTRVTTRYTLVLTKNGSKDILGELIAKKIEIEEEINKKLKKGYELLRKIENAIKILPQREQHLIRARYIECKKWAEICEEMHYSWPQVHRIHNKALDKLKKHDTQ